jgi:hypothetical protein
VVSRRQFECGVRLGNDVLSDFARAGVETGASTAVAFQSFKGLTFYGGDGCTVPGETTNPGGPADALAKLEQANQQIQALTARAAELQQNVVDREQKLQAANQQISDLQRRIVELTSAGPPGSPGQKPTPSDGEFLARVQALQRTLQLTNQMFDSQREICKLKQTACGTDSCQGCRAARSAPAAGRAKHRIIVGHPAFVRIYAVARWRR